MSFVEVHQGIEWISIQRSIYAKNRQDVERALVKERLDLEDFKALLSPAAEHYLEPLAQRAYQLTRQRFGFTIGMYVPLYLSNLCSNACTYCGFSMENRLKRRTLTELEIDAEIEVIKQMKFDNVLLVTGEHQNKVGMEYFRRVLPRIKKAFNYLSMEVQPLNQMDYQQLKQLGLDGVMVYQETYNPDTYAEHHLRGNKTDFNYRLDTPDRLAKAGIDKIGIGSLIGLEDWRTDCWFTAAHLDYLQGRYWQSRYSISFPRLRPCTGGVQPKSLMNDKQLVQTICAFRLLSPEVELSLSTRESARFRDHLLPLGITSLSAGSKTQPGGYAMEDVELEQFAISDERSPREVEAMLRRQGFDPVWRDWQPCYSG